MAKVLFINPVVREEDVPRHVPYGIALLAAIAIDKGHLVQVYDANAWRLGDEVLREVLAADDWQMVALGGMTTTYASVKKIATIAREVCPDAVIALGGGILTSMPQDMMTLLPQVDVGCIGEGFVTFPDMLDMIDTGGRDWLKVKGTISRGPEGRLRLSPQRELIHDLDSLPYPAWDLFPLEEIYFKNSEVLFSEEGMLAERRLDINASYGCSMVCRYCYHLGIAGDMRYEDDGAGNIKVAFDEPGKYSRVIRYHSPKYIVRMVKHMRDTYQIDYIGFLDENLMTMDQYSGRTWMNEICRLWHENGLAPVYEYDDNGKKKSWTGVHWSGTSHATLCTKEVLHVMRKAGCSHLVYGYESFAPHVMKTIGKGATPKTNFRSFFWTMDSGIRPVPNQIIGFPNEDFESIRINMEAWKELGIIVKPHFATPYPGSEWFTVYRKRILDQYGGDLEAFILDLGDASKISAVISHNFNAVELIGLRDLMLIGDTRKIDEYERIWRINNGIAEGAPSTLFPAAAAHVAAE
ncbi:MAG: cobalamin B12-binding domain-containing protein [Magnetospirillum sp.]|nr:cobalamin B12-binding domain-containing protein [Magnetospirillum sp.]